MSKMLTLEQEHQVRLEMLIEFDQFCRTHNLRYQLAYGTLLGAIRHHGFIPWDDDADLLMPLPDFLKLKEVFSSEKLQYCDIDTWKHFDYAFSRIVYKNTYSKQGLFIKSYGVFIDIYPVIGLPSGEIAKYKFYTDVNAMRKKYLRMASIVRNLAYISPVRNFPGFDSFMKKHRDLLLFSTSYEEANSYLHYCGPIRDIFEFDVFEELIDVEFEGCMFLAPKRYHEILTQRYNNYMELPPIEERKPYHGAKIYWK